MTRLRFQFWLLICLLAGAVTAAQPPKNDPGAAGAGRYSENVAIIRVDGEIDRFDSVSILRRIKEAEASNADALVLEINSPGGHVGAVLEITSALKRTPIPRTVAWINPKAYSGGALLALACREIVVNNGAALGDAAPILVSNDIFGGGKKLVSISDTERAKFLGPLLTDVVGSARRHGYDEKLVQGMVTLGVELWLVENPTTGQRLFIDRAEYKLLFDDDPPTSRPRLAGLSDLPKQTPPPPAAAAPAAPSSPTDLLPAAPMNPRLVKDVSLGLDQPSERPLITAAEKGKWRLVEYVSTGTGLITMTGDDMLHFKMAAATVTSADDLKSYLHAKNVVVQPPEWYEGAAKFMSNFWIRGVLIVIVILGLFIEFVHPGLILPGTAAGLALLALLLPDILMGLAGWWAMAAIFAGIILLALELFVLPGFGVFGAIGLVLLFGGLVMTFASGAGGLFPGSSGASAGAGVMYGFAFVVLGVVTTGVVMYYLSKSSRGLPVFNRLVLRGATPSETEHADSVEAIVEDAPASVGQTGVALTPLRPAGKMELEGRVVDVVSDSGYIAPGDRVRVTIVEQMRIVVEKA